MQSAAHAYKCKSLDLSPFRIVSITIVPTELNTQGINLGINIILCPTTLSANMYII